MTITLDEIINDPKAAIHTPKKEQADVLCAELHKRGKKWNSGKSYAKDNKWYHYGSGMCYCPSENRFDDLQWCKDNGYSIYEFSDVADFKTASIDSHETPIADSKSRPCRHGGKKR